VKTAPSAPIGMAEVAWHAGKTSVPDRQWRPGQAVPAIPIVDLRLCEVSWAGVIAIPGNC
jgi:hypothetical protein